MATPPSAPARPATSRPTQPVVMRPAPRPASGPPPSPAPSAPRPAGAAGPAGAAPWWVRSWLPITIGMVVVFPAVTLYSMGSFDPTLPAPQPYDAGATRPDGVTTAVLWAALALPGFVAGVGLRKRWPVVLLVITLAFAWTWVRHFFGLDAVSVELAGRAVFLAVLGLVVGIVAQVVYNVIGKPR